MDLNGLPHSLSGGMASLSFKDPSGNVTAFGASIRGTDAFVSWTVIGPQGQWTRAWAWTDAAGLVQVSAPIAFAVTTSP